MKLLSGPTCRHGYGDDVADRQADLVQLLGHVPPVELGLYVAVSICSSFVPIKG